MKRDSSTPRTTPARARSIQARTGAAGKPGASASHLRGSTGALHRTPDGGAESLRREEAESRSAAHAADDAGVATPAASAVDLVTCPGQ